MTKNSNQGGGGPALRSFSSKQWMVWCRSCDLGFSAWFGFEHNPECAILTNMLNGIYLQKVLLSLRDWKLDDQTSAQYSEGWHCWLSLQLTNVSAIQWRLALLVIIATHKRQCHSVKVGTVGFHCDSQPTSSVLQANHSRPHRQPPWQLRWRRVRPWSRQLTTWTTPPSVWSAWKRQRKSLSCVVTKHAPTAPRKSSTAPCVANLSPTASTYTDSPIQTLSLSISKYAHILVCVVALSTLYICDPGQNICYHWRFVRCHYICVQIFFFMFEPCPQFIKHTGYCFWFFFSISLLLNK